MKEERIEVLVVGAGPVGLLTALLLAKSGVRVKIIDQEQRPATHSYACALHPRSLTLLQTAGIDVASLPASHRINTLAFYEGNSPRAEITLCELPAEFPYVLVVPQDELEDTLAEELRRQAGVKVQWCHRLSDLHQEGSSVVATVDTLVESAKGYIVPEWDWEVKNQSTIRADFVVGADGQNSLVRKRLGIDYEQLGAPQLFAVYEFQSKEHASAIISIVMDDTTTNVLWPLTEHRQRWSFQLKSNGEIDEFPPKDRMGLRVFDPDEEAESHAQLERFIKTRAPWFTAGVAEIDWTTIVRFSQLLAKRFGEKRCWLAGDAAHQTGPAGIQSLNVGMSEAAELADSLRQILKKNASHDLLETYNRKSLAEWQRLLGIKGGLRATRDAGEWTKAHCARLLPCLPASGEDMVTLVKQLGLEFQ